MKITQNQKINIWKNILTTYIDSNNVDECLPYELISTKMWKFKNEHQSFVDDILFIKEKHPSNPSSIFLIKGARIGKTFTLMCIIQNIL